jgi:hypothetical protein
MPVGYDTQDVALVAQEVEQLHLRAGAFLRDPLADALAAVRPERVPQVAARDPALGERLADAQQRAEELAREAFALPDEDAVLLALHLLDLCPEGAFARLAAQAEDELQRWLLAEWLYARDAQFELEEERGPLAELEGWRRYIWLELITAIAQGETRPASLESAAPAEGAAPRAGAGARLLPTVIVHGTAAASATWWRERPGTANFWAFIRTHCPGLFGSGYEFTWKAGPWQHHRDQGARDFIDWWNTQGAPTELQVIAHSHGCNVVYLACALEPKLNVKNMVALGAPARIESPPPIGTGGRIQRIHNLYSEYDQIQVAGSLGGQRGEGRTLADGARITNHHVPWEDPGTKLVQVWHSDLHEESVWRGNGLVRRTLV